jgi:hypothetical protein
VPALSGEHRPQDGIDGVCDAEQVNAKDSLGFLDCWVVYQSRSRNPCTRHQHVGWPQLLRKFAYATADRLPVAYIGKRSNTDNARRAQFLLHGFKAPAVSID